MSKIDLIKNGCGDCPYCEHESYSTTCMMMDDKEICKDHSYLEKFPEWCPLPDMGDYYKKEGRGV